MARGRAEGLEQLRSRAVYERAPRDVASSQGCPLITSNWVQHNKGQDEKGEACVECWFVEMKLAHERRDDLRAGSPPLRTAWLVLSRGVSSLQDGCCWMSLDVASAFLHADALREIHFELPDEDREGVQPKLGGTSV